MKIVESHGKVTGKSRESHGKVTGLVLGHRRRLVVVVVCTSSRNSSGRGTFSSTRGT